MTALPDLLPLRERQSTQLRVGIAIISFVSWSICVAQGTRIESPGIRPLFHEAVEALKSDMEQHPQSLDSDTREAFRLTRARGATLPTLYRALLFGEAYYWMHGKAGMSGSHVEAEVSKVVSKVKLDDSVECATIKLLSRDVPWGNKALYNKCVEILGADPTNYVVRLSSLYVRMGYGPLEKEIPSVIADSEKLLREFPKLTALHGVLATAYCCDGTAHLSRRKQSWTRAASEYRTLVSINRSTKKTDPASFSQLEWLDKALEKMK